MTDRSISDEEQRFYRFNDFPATNSERREFIFARTGFSAKPLDRRGWYLFNSSMNEGLKLGLDERSLQILSLMDHALAGVKRFRGFPHMHEIAGDSTAAHSKQAMNIVQHVVENASSGLKNKDLDTFRRDAILATWVHDMGEIVMELTIASEIFDMPPERRAAISHEKNALERELFSFGLELAAYATDKAKPDLFTKSMEALREEAYAAPDLRTRMEVIREGMQKVRNELGLSGRKEETTERLLTLYDCAEDKAQGNFLHPFVKTLEAVEGHRYLQRNSGLLGHTKLEWITSNEIIEACKRCEKRLPDLFAQAGNDMMLERLAVAAAEFTYRSAARQFLPHKDDFVSMAPAYIDRSATPDSEINSNALLPRAAIAPLKERFTTAASRVMAAASAQQCPQTLMDVLENEFRTIQHEMDHSTLEAERTRRQEALAKQWQASGVNKPVHSCEEAGLMYRAAERAVTRGWRPESASLIAFGDSPKLPARIEMMMRQIHREMHENKVHSFTPDRGRGR